MNRQIKTINHSLTLLPVNDSFEPAEWLLAQAQQHRLKYLLAQADDGVIWGYIEGEKLVLAHDDFPEVSPRLRAITLQQARLFSPQAELLLWLTGQGWQARLIQDGQGEASAAYYDEAQILWGNHSRPESTPAFTLVAEGDMGHWHAVPLATTGAQFTFKQHPYHPLRLHARHYLQQDEASGLFYVTYSRLLDLRVEEAK